MLDLLGFLASLAILWRVVLGIASGLILAFALSKVFAGFPGGASTALAFIGGSVGAVWHVAVLAKRQPPAQSRQSQPEMSSTFKFLGAAIIGCGWGWLINSHFGPIVATLSLVLGPLLLSPVFVAISKQPLTLLSVGFITAAFLSGFLVTYALQLAVGGA